MLTGSMCFCAVAEKILAIVGHCVTSEYLEVCTDKFFCVSGVAQRQEQQRVERERLVREREGERAREAARIDRDRAVDRLVREAARITREGLSFMRGWGVERFLRVAAGLLRERKAIRLEWEREGGQIGDREAEREREGERLIWDAVRQVMEWERTIRRRVEDWLKRAREMEAEVEREADRRQRDRAAREREEERLGREREVERVGREREGGREREEERLGREREVERVGRERVGGREKEEERLGREREGGRERVARGRLVYFDCPGHCLPCPASMELAPTPPAPRRSGRARREPCRYQSVDFRR